VSLLAKAACQPTNPQLTPPNLTVGASLLAKAACQPTNPQLTSPNPNVGAAEGCDLLILALFGG
jgi:hypothetical protein